MVDLDLDGRNEVAIAGLEAISGEGGGVGVEAIDLLEPAYTKRGHFDKLAGLFMGGKPQVRRNADDPAAILFTSGSEGRPKGVVLSHRNILSNAIQSLARIAVNGDDLQ